MRRSVIYWSPHNVGYVDWASVNYTKKCNHNQILIGIVTSNQQLLLVVIMHLLMVTNN